MHKHHKSRVGYDVITATNQNVSVTAGTVKIQNQGNTRVLVDNHICLDPLETYELSDFEGGVIQHVFSIEFFSMASPPSVDPYRIYNGNRVLVITVSKT